MFTTGETVDLSEWIIFCYFLQFRWKKDEWPTCEKIVKSFPNCNELTSFWMALVSPVN